MTCKPQERFGFRAAVLQNRGDWQWHKACIGIVGWGGEGPDARICYKCQACKHGANSFLEMGMDAGWRRTYVTDKEYLRDLAINGDYVSGLFKLPGFLPSFISADRMHAADPGISQYLVGNVMFELYTFMGGTMQGTDANRAILAQLLWMIRLASKSLRQLKPPINNLTLGMFKRPAKSPKMQAKAAECRHLVPCVLFILSNLVPLASPHEKTRQQRVMHLAAVYAELQNWTEGSGAKIAEHGRRHCLLYAEMGRRAEQDPWVVWRVYPKHHLFLHIVEEQVGAEGNPKDSWCYLEEDAIGRAVSIAESGHASTLQKLVIQKHRLAV